MMPQTKCFLCGVKGQRKARHRPYGIQRHHLTPCDGRGPRRGKTVKLCGRCHGAVHRRWSNEELASRYNTPGLLKLGMEPTDER